jgi:hypothetical protein
MNRDDMNRDAGIHVSAELIGRYVLGDTTIGAEAEWALEVHLESCAACRTRVAEAVTDTAPEVAALTDTVWTALTPELATHRPAGSRHPRVWLATWASPATISWIMSATLVAVIAAAITRIAGWSHSGLYLVALAPVVPVLGVAVVWSRHFDPMHELVVGTPRAGLTVLLRRTAAVLVAVVPMLAAASVLVGISPLLWLLPCLACVSTSLALGTAIGAERAALCVAGVWFLAFVAPSLLRLRPPPDGWGGTPVWAAVTVLAAIVLVLRGGVTVRIPRRGAVPRKGL